MAVSIGPSRLPHCSVCRKTTCPHGGEYRVAPETAETRGRRSVPMRCRRCGYRWNSTARSAFALARAMRHDEIVSRGL